jgi:membrane protein DedA with SNARE-associated domain
VSFAHAITDLLDAYGLWVVAVGVGIESSGIPFPGETILVVAATYAGHSHRMPIGPIVAAAAAGAIVGDNLGFAAGHVGGMKILHRYGRHLRLDERRLKLGIWAFRRYGALVVFFGRFIAVLRAWAALLAGTNRMPWTHFLLANAAGGIAWAALVGLVAFHFGEAAAKLAGAAAWGLLAVTVVALVCAVAFLKKHEERFLDLAEREVPGPLDQA